MLVAFVLLFRADRHHSSAGFTVPSTPIVAQAASVDRGCALPP
jgi:hypothetical protein